MRTLPRSRRWRATLVAVTFIHLPCLYARGDCTATNLGIRPLNDLGFGTYKNSTGGLYPNGANSRPTMHEAEGLRMATEEIQPRNATGNVDTNSGKIVLLSIGMSNTTQEFGTNRPGAFKVRADADPSKNPQLVVVDGAQGGQAATDWTNSNSSTWNTVQNRLTQAGVTTNQVQIIWMKQARRNPTQAFPVHAELLQNDLETILRVAQRRYPNLKIAYLSSRTRSYATNVGALNPEPFAYESAFSVRWLIEKQLAGNLNYNPGNGPVVVPWLSWGPYLWADGTVPRSDGFTWLCSNLQSDFTHPSDSGVYKVATQLLSFFKTDPTATPWFLRKTTTGQPPVCAPAASTNSGVAPLAVNFSANAGDADGGVREYLWTFEDGTFSTNANPVKIFPAPGTYRARVTVTDNDGNTALGSLTIEVSFSRASLDSPAYGAGQFQVLVNGATNLNHIIQSSSDLMNWVPLQTNRGPFVFTDPAASNFPARFYRGTSVP